MNKYQESIKRIKESFGCDPAYYGLNVEFEFLQELIDKATEKKIPYWLDQVLHYLICLIYFI